MKTFFLILGCLFYSVQGQLGFLGGKNPIVPTRLGNIPNPIQVPNLANLEKLFIKDWQDFGSKFAKTYSQAEAPLRKANFLQNFDSIQKLGQATGQAALNFGLKINEFADMLFDEFNQLFNGFNRNGQLQRHLASSKAVPFAPPAGATLPENVDWREKGAVSPVKNQQQCAGCWAFAVTGALEGQSARKTGKLQELSIQHLIDCATGKYDNDGCLGGLTETGFDYVEDNGLSGHSDYPYEAQNKTCRAKSESNIATCKGYARIPEGDEKGLALAVANLGPVSAAMHVTKNFQFYGKDIYRDPECGNTPDHLNHAMVIVGYGQEADGKKYWLVKNSYGDTWGMDGYLKLARDEGNMCGIATYARYPLV